MTQQMCECVYKLGHINRGYINNMCVKRYVKWYILLLKLYY